MDENQVIRLLRMRRVGVTTPRVKIFRYLKEHPAHYTVDDVFQALHPEIPSLSKATVYNTLHLFNQAGLCRLLTISEKSVVFDSFCHTHPHFICKVCGRIFDVPEAENHIPALNTIQGHCAEEVSLHYKGICKDCLVEENKFREEVFNT